MAKDLFSQEIERECLSAAILNQEDVVDVLPYITENHFYFKPHQVIFSVIKNFVMTGTKFDKTLLADKLISLGLRSIESISLLDYLGALTSLDKISPDVMMGHFRELNKYNHLRDVDQIGKELRKFASESTGKSSQEIIYGAEGIFAKKVNTFTHENDPVDLTDGMEEFLESIGNEPKEEGIVNPYEPLRKAYGNYVPGGLYIYVAPAKHGKSTFILDILNKTTASDSNVKALYLDTELTLEEQRYRLASALTGINEWYFRSGFWRKDSDMIEKVRKIWPIIKSMLGRIDHLYVAGKPIDELVSIVRRWFYKNNHPDFKPIIALDYIKLTGEKISEAWKEHQVIGQKADTLKKLAQELKCPIITAMQCNAGGEVAMSKQIKWFASFVAILRRKDDVELDKHGENFGTHIMTVTESRNMGQHAMGHRDFVLNNEGKWEKMFFNFEIDNFSVKAKGTLEDIIQATKDKIDMEDESGPPPF